MNHYEPFLAIANRHETLQTIFSQYQPLIDIFQPSWTIYKTILVSTNQYGSLSAFTKHHEPLRTIN